MIWEGGGDEAQGGEVGLEDWIREAVRYPIIIGYS